MSFKEILELCQMLQYPVGIKVIGEHWRWKSIVESVTADCAVIQSEATKQKFVVPISQIVFLDGGDIERALILQEEQREKKKIHVPKILTAN